MDTLKRCNKGHYYDSAKHTSCPFCGVQSMDINIHKTMAKRNFTEKSNQNNSKEEGKTVGFFQKQLGLEPVVGWVVTIEGPSKGQDYRIIPERNFIGRSEKNEICIPDDETISRENHAIISYNPKINAFRLLPGDSRGLVYLNDEEVLTPSVIEAYDVIQLGQTKLMFVPFCSDNFRWG